MDKENFVLIPFKKNESVWIWVNERYSTKEWVPPDYSLGGDGDGPFDRGHYNIKWHDDYKAKNVPFRYGLLDDYLISQIYSSEWECVHANTSAF